MNPPAIPIMKNAVRSMKAGDTKSFMEEVFTKNTAAQISDLVHQRFGDLFPSLPDITQ